MNVSPDADDAAASPDRADRPAGPEESSAAVELPASSELPPEMGQALVTLTAEVLPEVPSDLVPPALRPMLTFQGSARRRVVAPRLLPALDQSPGLRRSVAALVAEHRPELATELDESAQPLGDEAVPTLIAFAWLRGDPRAAREIQRRADAREKRESALAAAEQEAQIAVQAAQIEELTVAVAALRHDLLAAEERHRAETTRLRQRLGEARAQLRSLRPDLVEELTGKVAELAGDRDRLEAELARAQEQLRARPRSTDAAGPAAERLRPSVPASVRARLLLDTLQQASNGLRQELGLPALTSLPADVVARDYEARSVGVVGAATVEGEVSSGLGSLSVGDPARLRELFTVPRLHLIIDGYNVTRQGWPELSLAEQRLRLLRALPPVTAQHGIEVTVVFDAHETAQRPSSSPPRGIRVIFSPPAVIADDVMVDLVTAEPPGRPVALVTADAGLGARVRRRPATYLVDSSALVRLLGR